jgi:hypothetical protein
MMDEILNGPGMVCPSDEENETREFRDAVEFLKLTDKEIYGIYQRMDEQLDLIIENHYK